MPASFVTIDALIHISIIINLPERRGAWTARNRRVHSSLRCTRGAQRKSIERALVRWRRCARLQERLHRRPRRALRPRHAARLQTGSRKWVAPVSRCNLNQRTQLQRANWHTHNRIKQPTITRLRKPMQMHKAADQWRPSRRTDKRSGGRERHPNTQANLTHCEQLAFFVGAHSVPT